MGEPTKNNGHSNKPVAKTAKFKKKSELKKFAEEFVSDDASNVKTYLKNDVLIPAIKDLLSKLVKNAVDIVLYGEVKNTNSRRNDNILKPSYREYYSHKDNDDSQPSMMGKAAAFENVYFETRDEAEDVLSQMYDYLATYHFVSVGDLYEFSGMPTKSTDYTFGWKTLVTAKVARDGSEYYIKLQRPIPERL